MRIGIITGEYPPRQGGVGAYTQILAQRLSDMNHDVSILCRTDAHEDDQRIHLNNAVNKWHFNALRTIKTWITDHNFDIINLQFETAAYDMSAWVHLIPRYTDGVPLVTTFHDLLVPYLFPKAGPLRRWIVRLLARTSDGVIITNHEDKRHLANIASKRLIPIGSNIKTRLPDDFNRNVWRRRAGASEDDFLLAYFGFLNRTKGVEILLHDMSDLIQSGYPIKLIMIGGRTGTSDPANAAYATEIDALIDALDLSTNIFQTGYLEDTEVSAYLCASDAVTLPFRDGASYRRGSLMAAIAHGCAIITTTPQVDIPTFVHGENMLLARAHIIDENVPPYAHISQEVLRLYRNPDLRDKLRDGAQELSTEFDWTRITADYIQFFEHVTGETR